MGRCDLLENSSSDQEFFNPIVGTLHGGFLFKKFPFFPVQRVQVLDYYCVMSESCAMRQCCGGSSHCAVMDPVRALEDAAMRRGNTLNVAHCLRMGVDPDIVKLWTDGVLLEGHEHAPVQVMEDYPSVRDDPATAACELDRLTSEGKIYWYSAGDAPHDLHIAPTTLIVKQERSRLVHAATPVQLAMRPHRF